MLFAIGESFGTQFCLFQICLSIFCKKNNRKVILSRFVIMIITAQIIESFYTMFIITVIRRSLTFKKLYNMKFPKKLSICPLLIPFKLQSRS